MKVWIEWTGLNRIQARDKKFIGRVLLIGLIPIPIIGVVYEGSWWGVFALGLLVVIVYYIILGPVIRFSKKDKRQD